MNEQKSTRDKVIGWLVLAVIVGVIIWWVNRKPPDGPIEKWAKEQTRKKAAERGLTVEEYERQETERQRAYANRMMNLESRYFGGGKLTYQEQQELLQYWEHNPPNR